MQTRLTNSFITSARLISTQTLPRARWETGTHWPLPPQPSLSRGRGAGARGTHVWGARTVASSWGCTGKLGMWSWGRQGHPGGHCARWSTRDTSALSTHHRIIPRACHAPDWPGAGPCCPVLASDPAGSLPSRGWHWHPPGVTVGAVWGGKVGAGGAFTDAQMLQVSVGAATGSWAVPGDAAAPRWGSPGGSAGSLWLGASLSRQDGAQQKASDKLFNGGESCQTASSAPCGEQSASSEDPSVWGSRQGWHPQAPLGTAGHPLPSP